MLVSWEQFHTDVEHCEHCTLHSGCTQKVPGQGDIHSPLMLIGEAPGMQEDLQGLAFVGPAGQLLTKMLQAVQLPREKVYICNVLKCRPPENRTPSPDEAASCLPLLRQQVALIRPKIILLLGACALTTVLGPQYRITQVHGEWFEKKGTWIMSTFHPSALLRDPAKKRDAWEDLKKLRARCDEMGLFSNLEQH